MSKLLFSIAFVLFIISLSILIFQDVNNGKDTYHSWTKAICSDNKCQDFLVECSGSELLNMKPVSALVVLDNFKDLRENKKLC